MCAFLTPPLLPRVLPKALLGITCSCIIITRAKRRGNKTAAHSTPSSCIEDGCKRDVWAEGPRGIVGAMKAKAATAVEQVQPLASLVKLLTSFAESHQAIKPAVQVNTVESFCGTWIKDTGSSDSMDSFCDLFGVPRFLRRATRLMTGLELRIAADSLMVTQVCRVAFMSTTESYPLDGVHSSVQKRRDMRSGKQLGKLVSAAAGQMQLHVIFDGRLPGEALDTLQLQDNGNTLLVQHRASLQGQGSAQFKEVYRRR